MYTFEITNQYLTDDDKAIFNDYLKSLGLDNNIWDVFVCLFKASTKSTKPLLLKAYQNRELIGVTIVIKCTRYGKALFNNKFLSGIINSLNIPFFLWIKFGCCMDMMSNPGFVKDPEKADEVFQEMASYLKKNSILTIVNDYTKNAKLYRKASILPALPHALINSSEMTSGQDYLAHHKNIKRKLRVFRKKGGEYNRVAHKLTKEQIDSMKKCFLSTVEKSVFYLPYQDLYLNAAIETSKTYIDNVYYFIATINHEFIGYQAALLTGDHLNALHGAFDRNLKSTYHAYDILFVNMTEFAIENKLNIIDFGAVLNETKRKMINSTIDMSYFIFSKYSIVQWFFNHLLKLTKVQGKQQLQYRN